jgi:hypothetical protein
MTTRKDLFHSKQNTLLTELESIKDLLDGQEADNIPLLQDSVTPKEPEDKEPEDLQSASPMTSGDLPGQRSLFNEGKLSEAEVCEPTHNEINTHLYKAEPEKAAFKTAELNDSRTRLDSVLNNTVNDVASNNTTTETKTPNATSLSNNPFLPAHVRQRLQRDANNEQNNEINNSHVRVDTSYTQQLVDQLVAHHLPKIEQELRRKLLDVAKQHNDIIKK